jgi:Clostripain family
MTKFLKKIVKVLVDFISWFWNGIKPPETKPWCAVFYFVAQGIGIDMPNPEPGDLDDKLKEQIDALRRAGFDSKKMHVVYRAIWLNKRIAPVASVVGPIFPPHTNYFPRCSPTTTTPVNTEKDLPCFLQWVFKWCPADHYAVFFWGHSFGPAGLFSPGGGIVIPQSSGLTILKAAFEQFNTIRTLGRPPAYSSGPMMVREMASHTANGPTVGGVGQAGGAADSGGAEIVRSFAEAKLKVEVVLFQDCWMSTLETAYELADEVRYVIASQSLIPIGLRHPDFKWPYEQLIRDLLSASFPADLSGHITDFYSSHFADILRLPSVPIALLDLAGVHGITDPLTRLVGSLKAHTLQNRGVLIEKGRILQGQGAGLAAGDAALVDVSKMCEEMKSCGDPAVESAAESLLTALGTLIVSNKEVCRPGTHPPTKPLGFKGISVLYWPLEDPPQDEYISLQVKRTEYASLKFQKSIANNRWPALEQKPHKH